ncbi:MAG: DUF4160 domain-containing protein [Parachlamydia sp.]|jgi:hypothetical protein|nr:DUF4160 domain-containing protein [Parachlamydia sp.]
MVYIISNFYGMTVMMSLSQNDIKPHFQVLYDGQISKFSLNNGKMYEGNLISDGQDIIYEWYWAHKFDLDKNWKLLLENQAAKPIPPIL